MSLVTTLLAFLVALGVLIVFHEFGHYLAARACGVKVLRFSVGFGRPVFSRTFGTGTEWVLAVLPLGGYVKMLDEREGPVRKDELHRAFNRQNVGRRMFIVAAGPVANFALAILLYWAIFIGGSPDARPILSKPAVGTPAEKAGLNRGDRLVAINGDVVEGWQQARWRLLQVALDRSDIELQVAVSNGAIATRRIALSEFDLDGLEGDPVARMGFRLIRPDAVIGRLISGGAADLGGLSPGDRILAVNDRPISGWDEFVTSIRANPDRRVRLRILNNAGETEISVVPAIHRENGRSIGRIGAEPRMSPEAMKDLFVTVQHGILTSLGMAMQKTWETSVFSLRMIGRMIMGDVSWKNISGPVSIADYAGQSAQAGWVTYLAFLAIVSISLGVLNLLPIPLLDGGHLMYYLAELAMGRPLSEGAMELGQRIGLALLLFLMVFALYNDFNRLISG